MPSTNAIQFSDHAVQFRKREARYLAVLAVGNVLAGTVIVFWALMVFGWAYGIVGASGFWSTFLAAWKLGLTWGGTIGLAGSGLLVLGRFIAVWRLRDELTDIDPWRTYPTVQWETSLSEQAVRGRLQHVAAHHRGFKPCPGSKKKIRTRGSIEIAVQTTDVGEGTVVQLRAMPKSRWQRQDYDPLLLNHKVLIDLRDALGGKCLHELTGRSAALEAGR